MECVNCLAYGKVVEGKIILPCQNCAMDNNWISIFAKTRKN